MVGNANGKFVLTPTVISYIPGIPQRKIFTTVAVEIISKYPFMKSKVSPTTVMFFSTFVFDIIFSRCCVSIGCYSSNPN